MTLSRVFRIALLLALSGAVDAEAAVPRSSSSSREVFEVSLEHTSGYLLTARGRTVVETRAGCGTTHTVQRSLLDVTYKDGQPIRTDFVSETWETVDSRTLRFHIRNTQSGNGTEVHDGAAKLAADGSGEVTFTSRDKPFALPRGTMFPGAFSRAVLAAAEKGGTLENTPVFQGGQRSALVIASARIGRALMHAREDSSDSSGLLRGVAAWPILISYFPQDAEMPASEVAAHLYANGLLGSLSLIYPQFTLRAKLARVERLSSSCRA